MVTDHRNRTPEELEAQTAWYFRRIAQVQERLDAVLAHEHDLPERTATAHDGPERRAVPRLRATLDDLRAGLVDLHTPLVRHVAKGWSGGRREHLEDLMAAGTMGLLEAVDTFECDRGKFSSWAFKLIRRRIAEAKHTSSDTPLSQWNQKIRPRLVRAQQAVLAENPKAEPLGPEVVAACQEALPDGIAAATVIRVLSASRHADLGACAEPSVEDDLGSIEDVEVLDRIASQMISLDEEQRLAIALRLGFTEEGPLTWEEIGDRIGRCARTARDRYDSGIDTVRGMLDATPAGMF